VAAVAVADGSRHDRLLQHVPSFTDDYLEMTSGIVGNQQQIVPTLELNITLLHARFSLYSSSFYIHTASFKKY